MDSNYRKVEGILYSYSQLRYETKGLIKDFKYLKNNYDGASAIEMRESTSKTNKVTSVVENEVVNREYHLKKLARVIKHNKNKIIQITNALDILDAQDKQIIMMIYFYNIEVKDVARRLDLKVDTVKRKQKKALNEIENLILLIS